MSEVRAFALGEYSAALAKGDRLGGPGRDAVAAKLPAPPFPPAAPFAAGAVPVWRIRAQATPPDGVTFAREAVVPVPVRVLADQ